MWEWWGDGVPSLAEITETPDPPVITEKLKGDIDENGIVNARDVSELISAMIGRSALTASQNENADMNDDKNVNIIDLIMLKNELLK